jgi:hypothetical protein
VQITSPEWEAPYEPGSVARKRYVIVVIREVIMTHGGADWSQCTTASMMPSMRARGSLPLSNWSTYEPTMKRASPGYVAVRRTSRPFPLLTMASDHKAFRALPGGISPDVASDEGKIFLKDAPVF